MTNVVSFRKTVKPLATVSICAFILAVAVLAFGMRSFGWFSNNKEVSGTGMCVVVSDEGTGVKVSEYVVYKYSTESGNYEKGDNSEEFAMPRYDSVFTERNDKTSAIVRVELAITRDLGANESIWFDILCEKGLYETVTKEATETTDASDVDVIGSNLSNLINMKVLALKTGEGTNMIPLADSSSAEIETIYTQVTKEMEEIGETAQFVTKTDETEVAPDGTDYASLTKPASNITLYELRSEDYANAIQMIDGSKKLFIYIQINYDDALVQSYLQSQENAGVALQFGEETADGNQYKIYADLMTITLSAGPSSAKPAENS